MISLEKNKKYVVACSYGPDSMALLDMLLKEKYDVVVAHVNYHKRDVSDFEKESLRKYCRKHSVPIEVLDTKDLKCEGNFQNWAREIRYSFFRDVAEKHNCFAVLIAHQQDDLIETYLIQKQRGGYVKNPGIAEKTCIFDVQVIRPLLSYSKAELLAYDDENNVPYSIDTSNLTNDYTRNKIRHDIVEKMNVEERQKILEEIKSQSTIEQDFTKIYSVNDFLSKSNKEITLIISEFIHSYDEHIDLSDNFINEIRKAIQSKKSYLEIKLVDSLVLTREQGLIVLLNKDETTSYEYVVNDKKNVIDDDLFFIDFSSGAEDRNVSESDYPLTIKPVGKNDKYIIKDYVKEVRRLFIDWKVPHYLRDCWPGIYSREGKLIYIPRYREEFVDNHKSKFVIKFAKPKL